MGNVEKPGNVEGEGKTPSYWDSWLPWSLPSPPFLSPLLPGLPGFQGARVSLIKYITFMYKIKQNKKKDSSLVS